jgi:acyl-CoA thioesterase
MHPSVVGMLRNDHFSKWLGLDVIQSAPDFCVLQMTVREEMLNGFGRLHGGVAISLADSALAFAANYDEKLSIVLDSTAHYPAAAGLGDLLQATAKVIYRTKRTGVYDVQVIRLSDQQLIATLRGTIYQTNIEAPR